MVRNFFLKRQIRFLILVAVAILILVWSSIKILLGRKISFLPSGQSTGLILTFAVYGDSRSSPSIHSRIVNLIAQNNPAIVLHTGDIITCYGGGYCENQWKTQYEDVIGPLVQKNIKIYPSIGNHEIMDESDHASCNNTAAIDEYRRHFPHVSFNSYGDYSFDIAGVHFLSIDGMCYLGTQAKFDWIGADLVNNRSKIIFAYLHRPPYTVGKGCVDGGRGGGVDERIVTAFRQNNVAMVFAGDDHSYQRLHPPQESTTFFVAAGGGAPLYDRTCNPSWVNIHKKEHNFILVNVYSNRIETKAINVNGELIDEYTKGLTGTPFPTNVPTVVPPPPSQGFPKITMPSGGMALPSENFLRNVKFYDLIQISAETLVDSTKYNLLKEAKRENPNLLVLLYVASQEVPAWTTPLYGNLYTQANRNGWLRSSCGSCYCWNNNPCVDISSGWKTFLPETMNIWINQQDPSQSVNGVFYDNVMSGPFCCPQNMADWQIGMKTILDKTNGIVGGNTMIYPTSPYSGHLEFAGHESWPGLSTPCGYRSNWNNGMRAFYGWVKAGGLYGLSHNPTGKGANDFATMRLGLATSLLANNGYYNYWPGVAAGITWYDEYGVDLSTGRPLMNVTAKGYLGQPVGEAYDPLSDETLSTVYNRNTTSCTDNTEADLSRHVWLREYQNGLVIANPSSNSQTISLRGSYKKIRGNQDPSINNGQTLGGSVTIPANDGLILLRVGVFPTTPVGPTSTPRPTTTPGGPTATSAPGWTCTGSCSSILSCQRGCLTGTCLRRDSECGWAGYRCCVASPSPSPTPIFVTPSSSPCLRCNFGNLDIDDEGKIDRLDLDLFFLSWSPRDKAPDPPLGTFKADLNSDGFVDEKDLTILLNNWSFP